MERALCKRDSGVAQIAPFNQPLRKQRDRGGWEGYERGFRGSWSPGRELWRGAQVSRFVDKGLINAFPGIESGRGFAVGVTALWINVSTDFFLSGVALKNCLFFTEDSVESEYDGLLEKLNRYEMKSEQLMNLTFEMDAAMKAMSLCLVDMKKK